MIIVKNIFKETPTKRIKTQRFEKKITTESRNTSILTQEDRINEELT